MCVFCSDFLLSVALIFALLLSLFSFFFVFSFCSVGPKSFYGIFMWKLCASPPQLLHRRIKKKYHNTSNSEVLYTRTPHTHTCAPHTDKCVNMFVRLHVRIRLPRCFFCPCLDFCLSASPHLRTSTRRHCCHSIDRMLATLAFAAVDIACIVVVVAIFIIISLLEKSFFFVFFAFTFTYIHTYHTYIP